jgi:uncharacterized OsmC-like protein
MSIITAEHLDGDQFAITARQHRFTVDQPVADGGDDTAPTPTELFIASLVGCVAFYARRYLARHNLPTAGLRVAGDYEFGSRPTRVSDIRVQITLPDGIPDEARDPLLAVASRCTVHNTLATPPHVTVALAGSLAPEGSTR